MVRFCTISTDSNPASVPICPPHSVFIVGKSLGHTNFRIRSVSKVRFELNPSALSTRSFPTDQFTSCGGPLSFRYVQRRLRQGSRLQFCSINVKGEHVKFAYIPSSIQRLVGRSSIPYLPALRRFPFRVSNARRLLRNVVTRVKYHSYSHGYANRRTVRSFPSQCRQISVQKSGAFVGFPSITPFRHRYRSI